MITEIENFTIQEFLNKDPEIAAEYQVFLEELNPKNYVNTHKKISAGKELHAVKTKHECETIWDLSYDTVDTLKDVFTAQQVDTEAAIEAFGLVFGLEKSHVLQLPILDFYPAINFMRAETINIIMAENDKLSYTSPDTKYVMAIEEYRSDLNQIGNLGLIDSLAKGDLLKWDEVVQQPYRRVFYKMYIDVIDRKINDKRS